MSNDQHIREAFGLTLLKNSHPDIRRLKRQTANTTLHGNKFWQAASVLIDYLQEFPPEPGSRILEIGCGWGLAGIFCAKQYGCEVVALDADESVFPFLEHHALLNQVQVDTVQMGTEAVTTEQLAGFDLVIGSDICFWESLTQALGEFIERAIDADIERMVIADPGRPTFRTLAEAYAGHDYVRYTDWAVPEPHNSWGLILDLGAP
ncbi:class I SAM-dependent methyltransferase [Halioxenophilus sp. WMMB6]|uniref:class I SAM-dependent methyltransferase n=1 Tax=Halioxenophilus sp. WMMB6 TaxID=3073815 RepID=UPI00295F5134|nr:methyltransferase domain-containing protein [Halioxenophilus sp. WMMB6]